MAVKTKKIKGTGSGDSLQGLDSRYNIIYGYDGDDTIYGGALKDTIYGGGGNDLLCGQNGNDIIYGSDGDDTIYGGTGNDKLYGEAGNNIIVFAASDGNDTVYSGKGTDTIAFSDITDYTNIKLYSNGTDLKLKYSDNDSILISKYIKSKGVSSVSSVLFGYNGSSYTSSMLFTDFVDKLQNQYGVYYFGSETKSSKYYGTYLNDSITGGKKADTFKGGSGEDTIIGNGGKDKLYGQDGNDLIYGDDINFTLSGNDYIDGGSGNDTIYAGGGNDKVYGKDGNDLIYGDDKDFTLSGNDYIDGGSGDDTIYAGAGNDKIYGKDGNDLIYGDDKDLIQNGNDYIDAGSGNDTVYAGKGNDTVKCGSGDDIVFGGQGNDKIYTQDGNNVLIFNTADGYDTIYSGKGNDVLVFEDLEDFDDILFHTNGKDLIIKYSSFDSVTISGYIKSKCSSSVTTLAKSFNISDNSYSDTANLAELVQAYQEKQGLFYTAVYNKKNKYYGTYLNDFIYGGYLNDTFKGGSGSDTIIGLSGNDKLYGQDGDDYIIGDDADFLLTGDDYIDGGAGNDTLYGGYGNDTLKGGSGDDYITGGRGNDKLYGGTGTNNFYFAEHGGNDTIYAGGGTDIINISYGSSTESYDLSYTKKGSSLVLTYAINSSVTIDNYFKLKTPTVDDIIVNFNGTKTTFDIKDSAVITINAAQSKSKKVYGTALNDKINGSAKSELIKAGAGNDIVYGRIGNDTIYGGAGDDTIYGGVGNDKLYGEAGNNIFCFSKGDGADTVYSGKGNDTIAFTGTYFRNLTFSKSKNNFIVMGYGEDTDKVVIADYYKKTSSVKTIKTTDGEFAIPYSYQKGSDNADVLFGTDKIDYIVGGAGNDVISGGGGDDYIFSGAGNDYLLSDSGNNTFFFASGDGDDSIKSGLGSDTIKLYSTSFSYKKQIGSNNLVISHGKSDSITLLDYFGDTGHSVKNITDALGNTSTLSASMQAKGMNITGTDDNDTIIGTDGNDTITAGKGDDYINAGAGSNTLYFDVTSGNDTLAYNTEKDTLVFDKTVQFECSQQTDSDNLLIAYSSASGSGTITIEDYFKYESSNYAIKNYTATGKLDDIVASGMTITGTDGNDTITGTTGADTINAGTGNDLITPGAGDDVIILSKGSGNDTIVSGKGTDTLKFDEKMDFVYNYYVQNNDLVINYSDSDSVTLQDYFGLTHSVARIKYDDEKLNIKDEVAKELNIYGTDGNDTIDGSSGNNIIYGGSGDTSYVTTLKNKSFDKITDTGGSDKLVLQRTKSEVSLYFNVTKDGTASGSLYVKAKSDIKESDVGVEITDYLNDTSKVVEKISAGANSTDASNSDYVFTYDTSVISTIKQEVAAWLTENDYASVNDVLSKGSSTDINAVIAYFDDKWTQT